MPAIAVARNFDATLGGLVTANLAPEAKYRTRMNVLSRPSAAGIEIIPAIGGFGNARSVGAVQSVLACGGVARGVRLLSEAGCERVFEEQYREYLGCDPLLPRAFTLDIETLALPGFRDRVGPKLERDYRLGYMRLE